MAGLAPVDILRGIPGSTALTEEDRESIAALGTTTTVRPGTIVVATGQRTAALQVILSGRVRLVNDAGSGAPVPLDLLSEGASLGDGGLWADETSAFSARAMTEVVLFTLARDDFARLLERAAGDRRGAAALPRRVGDSQLHLRLHGVLEPHG